MPLLTTECVCIIPFQLSLYFSSLLLSLLPPPPSFPLLPPSPSSLLPPPPSFTPLSYPPPSFLSPSLLSFSLPPLFLFLPPFSRLPLCASERVCAREQVCMHVCACVCAYVWRLSGCSQCTFNCVSPCSTL